MQKTLGIGALCVIAAGSAFAGQASKNSLPGWHGEPPNPACAAYMNGTSCNAIDAGLKDQATGLAWRRVPGTHTFEEARTLCESTFGSGWRLPTLAELEAAYDKELFGYCDMSVLTNTEALETNGVWHMGARYEGEPRCEQTPTGERYCVGGCGALWVAKQPVAKTEPHTVVCVL